MAYQRLTNLAAQFIHREVGGPPLLICARALNIASLATRTLALSTYCSGYWVTPRTRSTPNRMPMSDGCAVW